MAGKSKEDISSALEYVKNRVEVAVFDAPIIADEAKDVVTTVKAVQRITTAMMLGFRPVTMVKEFAIGLYKGISLASTKIYGGDQFTLADYTRALTAMMTIDNKFSLQFNLIDNINRHYRFANQDANSLDEKWKVNRRGAMLGLSP